jgi:Family of unknown function (DUF6009)
MSDHREALKFESELIWLVDNLDDYPWVREVYTEFTSPTKITQSQRSEIELGHKLIGYSIWKQNTTEAFIDPFNSTKYYGRRIFVIRDDDYKAYESYDYFPTEAVDPLTVKVGSQGLSPKVKSQIAVRIPVPILRKLIICSRKTGMNQTDVVIAALTKYFETENEMLPNQRLDSLEKRVSRLEGKK